MIFYFISFATTINTVTISDLKLLKPTLNFYPRRQNIKVEIIQ